MGFDRRDDLLVLLARDRLDDRWGDDVFRAAAGPPRTRRSAPQPRGCRRRPRSRDGKRMSAWRWTSSSSCARRRFDARHSTAIVAAAAHRAARPASGTSSNRRTSINSGIDVVSVLSIPAIASADRCARGCDRACALRTRRPRDPRAARRRFAPTSTRTASGLPDGSRQGHARARPRYQAVARDRGRRSAMAPWSCCDTRSLDATNAMRQDQRAIFSC